MKLMERPIALSTLEDLLFRRKARRPSVLIVSGPSVAGTTALPESPAERVVTREPWLHTLELAPLARPGLSSVLAEFAPQPMANSEDLRFISRPHPTDIHGLPRPPRFFFRDDTGHHLAPALAEPGEPSPPRFLTESAAFDAVQPGEPADPHAKAWSRQRDGAERAIAGGSRSPRRHPALNVTRKSSEEPR
jgi:hypothetical protein